MGFLVTFHYYEKDAEQNDFNREEGSLKTRVVTIGSPNEPVSMERVAATIMKEYTKSHIWVENVEVDEWVKKPLKFVQTKTGVKIGAKPFNLGLNEIMKWAVDENDRRQMPSNEMRMVSTNVSTDAQQQNSQKLWPHELNSPPKPQVVNRPNVSAAGLQYAYRQEVCNPPPELVNSAQRLNLTVGKAYNVLDEQGKHTPDGVEYSYRIKDDSGMERLVSWNYFKQRGELYQHQQPSGYDSRIDPSTGMIRNNHNNNLYQEPVISPQLSYQNTQYRSNNAYANSANSFDVPDMSDVMKRMDAALERRNNGMRR